VGEKLQSVAKDRLTEGDLEEGHQQFWEGLRDGKLVVTFSREDVEKVADLFHLLYQRKEHLL
jgi:hypothetical protein